MIALQHFRTGYTAIIVQHRITSLMYVYVFRNIFKLGQVKAKPFISGDIGIPQGKFDVCSSQGVIICSILHVELN